MRTYETMGIAREYLNNSNMDLKRRVVGIIKRYKLSLYHFIRVVYQIEKYLSQFECEITCPYPKFIHLST